MSNHKLLSTLTLISTKSGDSFKYEIYNEIGSPNYFAVILVRDDVVSQKWGPSHFWIEINGYYRLSSANLLGLEQDCISHFANTYQ